MDITEEVLDQIPKECGNCINLGHVLGKEQLRVCTTSVGRRVGLRSLQDSCIDKGSFRPTPAAQLEVGHLNNQGVIFPPPLEDIAR